MNDKKIDDILMQALSPDNEPEQYINQKILKTVKERRKMNIFKKIPVAVLVGVLIATVSCAGVAAALIFLSPDKVADQVHNSSLSKAFSSENAVNINQTQSYNDKNFTLMGLVSGKNISDCLVTANGEIKSDRTYCVLSVTNADGTPVTLETAERFFISPYIEGYNPAIFNICSLNGASTEVFIDGVQYKIIDCDNLEKFADHNIKLGITSGDMMFDHNAFSYDEKTGKITSVENYDKINILFDLPIDKSKADPAAAAAYMDQMLNGSAGSDEETSDMQDEMFNHMITIDNINDYCTLIPECTSVCTPDDDGVVTYEFSYDDYGKSNGSIKIADVFPDENTGTSQIIGFSGYDNVKMYVTCTLNANGTVTVQVYKQN